MAGLYIHLPFCKSKCPYCDFYSVAELSLADEYVSALCRTLKQYADLETAPKSFDTLYLGGGTPSFVGAERLRRLIGFIGELYGKQGEVTVECNPSSTDDALLYALAESGVNRLSFGMQSAVDCERRSLGRLSDTRQVERVIGYARAAGIDNISLDLMSGIPGQTIESLGDSIDFCLSQNVPHVSSYMLQLEPGTFFYKKQNSLKLPSEDETCDMYLETVKRLGQGGLKQYEISNFARPGFESRHNLNYWNCGEYLGIGAAAHSFIQGKRFYYERSIRDFIEGKPPCEDGTGGDFEEYAMLRLRLSEGLSEEAVQKRFGFKIPDYVFRNGEKLARMGLVGVQDRAITLTVKGFLLSNSVIAELLREG